MTWMPIPIFAGEYSASDTGEIRHNITGRIFIIKKKKGVYPKVSLFYDGRYQTHRVHRLVLMAHKGIDPSKPIVNHIDGEKSNSILENLEWVTMSQNHKHAYDSGLKSKGYLQKKVLFNGEVYDSVIGLSKILNLPKTCISAVCRGQMKSYKGLHFKYLDNENV